jgi:hypothetical protein
MHNFNILNTAERVFFFGLKRNRNEKRGGLIEKAIFSARE